MVIVARHRLDAVLDGRLCSGCGACAFVGRSSGVTMIDVKNVGRRPQWNGELPTAVKDQIIECCPGAGVRAPAADDPPPTDPDTLVIGPSVAIYEGWAGNPEVRRAGSSGGVVTALASYCVEKLGMSLVVHTGMDVAMPWLNKTIRSVSGSDLASATGSRYAPSSPVEALDLIESSDKPCVFIGKPCDVAAVAQLRKTRPALDRNLGLVLSFFCAGTPSTNATLGLVDSLGFSEPEQISSIRYRGDGWPGLFRVRDRSGREATLTYEESWGTLARRHRQLRCQLCPDGLGELADVTSGDAWHRRDEGTDGISVILARNEHGQQIVDGAIRAGYLVAAPSTAARVVQAQGLVKRRRLIAARLAALRVFGLPVPAYSGFHLLRAARQVPMTASIKEFGGMVRRIIARKYRKPEPRN